MSLQTKQLKLLLQEEDEHLQQIKSIQEKIAKNMNTDVLPEETFEHLDLDD